MTDGFTKKILIQPIFDPKYLENTIEILLNQSIITKKNQKNSQNPKSTCNKNSS